MKDIKCPKCGAVISVDDSVYATILQQVRTGEFDKEVEKRLKELQDKFLSREEAVKAKAEKSFEQQLSEKDLKMSALENEITRLQGIIAGNETTKKSEILAVEVAKDKEHFEIISEKEKRHAEIIKEKEKELAGVLSEKDKKIAALESQLSRADDLHKVALLEERETASAINQTKEKEIIELKSRLAASELAAKNREIQLNEQHKLQLQDKEAEIERLRDYRLRLSTKMVGETLEQHCSIKFEEAQSNGQFPKATFIKDNIAVEGTKGDFIFRDYVDDEEYVSIMFEMKNEMDATAAKHKNDDFLEKLDKDRNRKGCEYAVLVSMLEQDNELYNNGIVDKSHKFPKMIVIRPQFFIPVLRLISEGARKGFMERYALMKELESARSQSLDFAKFEEKINRFRTSFNNNVTAAHKKFVAANDGIDKVIESLEKQIKALRDVKASFEASEQKLLKANELADEDLTVKKLTYGAPSVRKMIEKASKTEN